MNKLDHPIDGPVFWVFKEATANSDIAINPAHIVGIYPQIEGATIEFVTGSVDVATEFWDILDQYGRYWAP